MRRDPDPLDVQAGVPPALRMKRLHPAVVREHREIYIRGYVAGLAAPVRRRHGRFAWVAVVLATIALVLTAFWTGHVTAAPRPAAQVTPSELSVGSLETEPALRTEAPSTPVPSSAPAPQPSGGIGQPASYCKPGHCETPAPQPRIVSHGTSGEATWFDVGPGIYAAIRPDLGHKGDLAIVCGGAPFHCVSAPITDVCACLGPNSDRLIDLSIDAFRSFADPSAGVLRITLQVLER